MFKWINAQIVKKYKKTTKPRSHKELTTEAYERFHPKGDGLFLVNIQGVSNSFVAKCIEYFSGKLTHSFIMIYSTDLRSWFTDEQWTKLSAKWNYYYGTTTGIPLTTKTLILGSLDQDGNNICDYTHYQNRKQSIRKLPVNSVAIKAVLAWLCQDKILNAGYDYSGLATQPLHKILPCMDVKEDFYCSEFCYEMMDFVGYKVAKKPDPSPKNIEDYRKDLIFFTNLD